MKYKQLNYCKLHSMGGGAGGAGGYNPPPPSFSQIFAKSPFFAWNFSIFLCLQPPHVQVSPPHFQIHSAVYAQANE